MTGLLAFEMDSSVNDDTRPALPPIADDIDDLTLREARALLCLVRLFSCAPPVERAAHNRADRLAHVGIEAFDLLRQQAG